MDTPVHDWRTGFMAGVNNKWRKQKVPQVTSRWCQSITSTPIPQQVQQVIFAIWVPDVYLQVLDAELMAIHVDGRQEDGLHLVVAQFIWRQVRCDKHLKNQNQ